MANCRYCGQSAGFLRWKHKACQQKHNLNTEKITTLLASSLRPNGSMYLIKTQIIALAKQGYVTQKELDMLCVKQYNIAIQKFLYDGILTKKEEQKIMEYTDAFALDQSLLDQHGAFQKFIKAVVLRDISQGKMPSVDHKTSHQIPFELQKGEYVIWVFEDVELYKKKDSLIQESDSAWEPVDQEEEFFFNTTFFKTPVHPKGVKMLDFGLIVITNKKIYITSDLGNFTIDLDTIVTMVPYEDGIGLTTNQSHIPFQVLRNLDGWFTYNILSNVINQY